MRLSPTLFAFILPARRQHDGLVREYGLND